MQSYNNCKKKNVNDVASHKSRFVSSFIIDTCILFFFLYCIIYNILLFKYYIEFFPFVFHYIYILTITPTYIITLHFR